SFVANDRRDRLDLLSRRIQQRDSKGDGEASPIFVHCGNAKNFCAVSGLTRSHYSSISFPMPEPKTFGNNQVERMAEGFRFGVPENSLRGPIPQKNGPIRSCAHHATAG